MQIVTSWMRQGAAQEAQSLVLRLLKRRIGEVSSTFEAKLMQLSVAQLEALGEALLDFSSPSDLDHWLQTHS